jgi:hypothetical protein
MKRLLQNCKIVPAVIPNIGTVGAMTPVEVDGRGFSRALFMLATGAATATGTMTAKVQKAATAGGVLADCTGAALTNLADTDGSKVFAIDVTIDPAKPFMKITAATVTEKIANAWICLLYGGSGTYPKSAPASEAVHA